MDVDSEGLRSINAVVERVVASLQKRTDWKGKPNVKGEPGKTAD